MYQRGLLAGLQEAYDNLKPPIDDLSWVPPIVAVIYIFAAAWMFTPAVKQRNQTVFGLVLLVALLATGVNYVALKKYFDWKYDTTRCNDPEFLAERALNSTGVSVVADCPLAIASASALACGNGEGPQA